MAVMSIAGVTYYYLFLLVAHCIFLTDARKSAAFIFRSLPHSKIFSNVVVRHLDIIGIVGNHVLSDSTTSSQPNYNVYGSLNSPFTLPSFESLPPMPLSETNSPFCYLPPSTPQPPASPQTTVPPPISIGGGGGNAGGGYNYPSPPPPSSSNIPPILPLQSPPPSPIGGGGGGAGGGNAGGGYNYHSPPPPSPIGTSPIGTDPPAGSCAPSPPQPILSPPTYYEPSPPSGVVPSPPLSSPTPTTPIGGYVPNPPVFQPPVVYPQPKSPPTPSKGPNLKLWCVAKGGVPDPIIQEAMDYACGSGADCDSLQSNESCFEPNTVSAHASYAFNSYWQRTKVAGGTCDFGGAAILVTKDPSHDGCHYMYN